MRMVTVIKAGIQTTLQDLGRQGFAHQGIVQAGALDSNALSMANTLAGNEANNCCIELAIGPFEILFEQALRIAICGQGFSLSLNNQPIKNQTIYSNWSYDIAAGTRLTVHNTPQSGLLYIAVSGGWVADNYFGSVSTDLYAGFGGYHGRSLQDGDQLKVNHHSSPVHNNLNTSNKALAGALFAPVNFEVRAIPAPEYSLFSKASQQTFWQTHWQITAASNRMGSKLIGEHLIHTRNTASLRSHAVLPGTVQIPANGQPIVLLADAQTTGGYPRIASVISADLWQFAQMPTLSYFQFKPCDQATARQALIKQQHAHQQLAFALKAAQC